MFLKLHADLSKDFSSTLSDSDDFNIIIQVGENENMKHTVIYVLKQKFYLKTQLFDFYICFTSHKTGCITLIFKKLIKRF